MVDLAAIGLVNGAWLNTCVENWHAEGRIHDGDMLRVNSHTTWRVRQLMHRWLRETGLNAAEERGALFGFARTAAHGGMACSHWWDTRAGRPR